ncbi:MAG: UDP-2,4-diacetamido-2,4,6-trideoxy-beta-L-altropyranose hydrolase, partial [Deltaproteobacteria bacterium]|nr:UDP-2,4-diacetamido-2,4,6-trideoxy-beta-L-altropyranose hydrolase [Deltaproteobacteria bacterium]
MIEGVQSPESTIRDMMNLLIRADADAQIGTGHVMRCLALAQACRAQGGAAVFLSHCESGALRQRIEDAGIGFIPLEEPHPAPCDLQTTFSVLAQLATGNWQLATSFLILDGYHFNPAYQHAVRTAGHRLLVIDDTGHLPHYHADVLLNYGLSATRLPYRCDADTLLLLGPRYALLRPEFLTWGGWQREIPDVARKVLVTLGGADPNNVTLKVMQALQQLNVPGLEVRSVVGPANPHLKALQRAVQPFPCHVQLLTGVTD